MESKSFKQVAKGYEMLTEVQQEFSQDSEMFNALGTALDLARQYGEAVQAFQLAVRFDPLSSPKEASLGQDYEALGDQQQAERHLEKAMELDSLNLSAAELLISIYERNGELSKADELSKKLIRLTRGSMEHK
jgi:tetratricopeptide (TPR) repeat protein